MHRKGGFEVKGVGAREGVDDLGHRELSKREQALSDISLER